MNKVEKIRRQFIQEQRIKLLKKLDVLTEELKRETDSIRADEIMIEMRELGNSLTKLVSCSVPDHEHANDHHIFIQHGRKTKKLRLQP